MTVDRILRGMTRQRIFGVKIWKWDNNHFWNCEFMDGRATWVATYAHLPSAVKVAAVRALKGSLVYHDHKLIRSMNRGRAND
jgi:hypothetical protein